MPYDVRKEGDKWVVYKQGTNTKVAEHDSKDKALAQIRAIYANTGEGDSTK